MGPALLLIAQLYRVEEQARPLTAEERLGLRQLQSRSILDKLHAYLLAIQAEVLPGSEPKNQRQLPTALSTNILNSGESLYGRPGILR